MSLATTPDPRGAVRARIAALLASPPPPHLSLADRLSDLATIRRLFPRLTPEADELEAALLRAGAVV